MKNLKVKRGWSLMVLLGVFLLILPYPGVLMGATIPSIEDVAAGKASLPTVEDLTGGKVKNTDVIDKKNVDLVKEYLAEGIYEMVKRGMVMRIGKTLPPDQLYPRAFREATDRNQGKAVMDENGVVYYEKKGTLWPGGRPYPWVKTGLEAMANHYYGRVYDTWQGIGLDMQFVNSKGEVYKTSQQTTMYVKTTCRVILPPFGAVPGQEDILVKSFTLINNPLELKGLGQYAVRYYDFAKSYDTGFAYIPAFKRSIRVSTTTYQDNIAGSDMTFSDREGFSEPCSDWNFKLLGRKFLFVHEPKAPYPFFDNKGRLSKEVPFTVGKKYPLLGWVIWPVDVVEAIPKGRHIYGKRVIFMPVWPYWNSGIGIMGQDIYDRQMRLWKHQYSMVGRQEFLDNDPQKPQTMFSGSLMHDFQADHATNSYIPQQLNVRIDAKDISMQKMLEMGR